MVLSWPQSLQSFHGLSLSLCVLVVILPVEPVLKSLTLLV